MATVCPDPVVHRSEVRALGTTAEVLLSDPVDVGRATALLQAELDRVDQLASRFRPDSELSLLNARTGTTAEVSVGLAELLDAALHGARATNGDVDPTVEAAMNRIGYDRDFAAMDKDQATPAVSRPAPGWQTIGWDARSRRVYLPVGVTLDLGATAKAVCADRAASIVANTLGCGALVSIGGDLSIAGPPPDGGWAIGVGDVSAASDPDTVHGVVALQSGGLATSGTAARSWRRNGAPMHHLVDPRTGLPVISPWRTVAVAAATCLDANIAATAAVIRGSDAPVWLEELGLPAVLWTAGGDVVRTEGWPSAEKG
jgi:thiamine biosynthesis lipoprotein